MDNKPFKRKRNKKSELKKARKYAKLGWFGRGTRVDEETYQYFLRIHELNIGKYENEEEKVMVANNALDQTKGQEVNMVLNQFLSRVIESLLPFAADETIERFISAFVDLRILCTDNFASHVVQTLVKVCATRFRAEGNEVFRDFVIRTSSFVFNNLEEFIYDSYANHIGRACLKECSGSTEEVGLSTEIVENLGKRILNWPEIKEMAVNTLASGFVQSLLESLSLVNNKIARKIIRKFLDEYYLCGKCEEDKKKDIVPCGSEVGDTVVPEFFASIPATRLLEAAIEVSKAKIYTKIFLQIFMNRLKILSLNKSSTIAVQKLISSCQDISEFGLMLDELVPVFPELISAGHLNILLALAKACTRLGTREGDFLKALKMGLNVENSCRGELVIKLIFSSNESDVRKVDLNGSLLLQTLFQFKKPISVVESFLAVDSKTLLEIFTNPRGSHLVDAFVSSKTIGEKSRDRMIQILKGHYKDLAMDKFGSRALEALWSRAVLKEKHIIMGELDRTLAKTMYGSIISEKFRLGLYLSDKSKWANTESASPAKIFSDILGK